MSNFVGAITTGANAFINLGTAMRTAGYVGGGVVSSGRLFNPDAAVLVYIHPSESGTTAPSTGTAGWPIGAGAAAAGNTFVFERGAGHASIDIGTTWLFTSAAIVIKVIASGA